MYNSQSCITSISASVQASHHSCLRWLRHLKCKKHFQALLCMPKNICIFIHKFQFFCMPRADLQNIRDECFCALSLCLASALIYLEVHEEIFNEITSCLCVSDVALYRIAVFTLFCLPNLKVYSAEIWIQRTAILGGLMRSMTNWKKRRRNTFHVNVLEWMVSEKTTSSYILKTHKTQKNRKRLRTSSSLWASTGT